MIIPLPRTWHRTFLPAYGNISPPSRVNHPWEAGSFALPPTSVCVKANAREESLKRKFPPDVSVEAADDRSLHVQALYKAISGLSETDRLIISLYLVDLKQSEIAQITGMSQVNVRVRIHRIKSILAKNYAGMKNDIDIKSLWKGQQVPVIDLSAVRKR